MSCTITSPEDGQIARLCSLDANTLSLDSKSCGEQGRTYVNALLSLFRERRDVKRPVIEEEDVILDPRRGGLLARALRPDIVDPVFRPAQAISTVDCATGMS